MTPAATLTFGSALRAAQGAPLSYLSGDPFYGPGQAYLLPRGSAGRLPWRWQLDLRAAVTYKLSESYMVALNLDVFNATDNRAVTAVDENYTFGSAAPVINGSVSDLAYLKSTDGSVVVRNANFLRGAEYQLPIAGRIGGKLAF